ncbi:hypothetical protein LTS15_010060 [Exophiala xenobiotica]|nr:hypothetical protein LTS15_010060 [Exophiala xenobiotica]
MTTPNPNTTTPNPEHDTDVDSDTIEVASYSPTRYQKTAPATTNRSALPPPLTTAAAKRRTSDEATAGGPSKKPKVSRAGKSPKSVEKPAEWPDPRPSSLVSDTQIWLTQSGDLLIPRVPAAFGSSRNARLKRSKV